MSDLISRSELIAKIKPPVEGEYATLVSLASVRKMLLNFANSVPSVDAAEVVRCKDCEHFLPEKMLCTHEGNMVFNTGKTTYPNCFCSYGERREDG